MRRLYGGAIPSVAQSEALTELLEEESAFYGLVENSREKIRHSAYERLTEGKSPR